MLLGFNSKRKLGSSILGEVLCVTLLELLAAERLSSGLVRFCVDSDACIFFYQSETKRMSCFAYL